MSDEFTWLVHPDIGIPWQCPTEAVGAWTVRGWETCDAPPEVDPTREHAAATAVPTPEQAAAEPAATDEPDLADEADDTIEGTE